MYLSILRGATYLATERSHGTPSSSSCMTLAHVLRTEMPCAGVYPAANTAPRIVTGAIKTQGEETIEGKVCLTSLELGDATASKTNV